MLCEELVLFCQKVHGSRFLGPLFLANFNYCPLVWHFCGAQNSKKLEKIQLRGLRFVFRDFKSDHDTLLNKTGINTINRNRLCCLATEVDKMYNEPQSIIYEGCLQTSAV